MALHVNFAARGPVHEVVDPVELPCLDKVSLTSINDFMRKFADDSSFCPPEGSFIFDTDIDDNINIDTDVSPSMDYDFEDVFEDDNARARED